MKVHKLELSGVRKLGEIVFLVICDQPYYFCFGAWTGECLSAPHIFEHARIPYPDFSIKTPSTDIVAL